MTTATRVEPRSGVYPAAWVLAVLIVASTLAFDPLGWAPFGPLEWALTSTLVLAVAALAVRHPFDVHRGSALAWLGFLAWGVVASLLAVDPVYTWIGSPDRHLGLVTWAMLGLAYLVGQSVSHPADLRVITRAIVAATIGMALYAAGETLGIELVPVTGATSRLGGTFGSPAYLGAALALTLPITTAVATDGTERFWWRAAATFGLGLGVVAVIGTQTRAAWAGLVVAAALSAPAWWRWLKARPWVAVAVGALLATIVAATPVGGRLTSAFDFEDGGGAARLDEWAVGVRALASHAATGTGVRGLPRGLPRTRRRRLLADVRA